MPPFLIFIFIFAIFIIVIDINIADKITLLFSNHQTFLKKTYVHLRLYSSSTKQSQCLRTYFSNHPIYPIASHKSHKGNNHDFQAMRQCQAMSQSPTPCQDASIMQCINEKDRRRQYTRLLNPFSRHQAHKTIACKHSRNDV